ncbi:MAG: M24 family metallopeptidase [Oscillospiraceae bacterium]
MLPERAQKLVAALPPGFEAALIGTEANRFYLLDFDAGDAGTLLVLPGHLVYIIDSRYIELAKKQVRHAEVLLEKNALAQLADIFERENVRHVYLEDGSTLAAWNRLRQKFADITFDTGDALGKALAGLREIKDADEVARMRRAQAITGACFTHILPFIKEGVREVDLMLEMEHYMRSHGAQQVAFDTICVAGPNTSLPHGVPGEYRVQKGDFITMDFGAKVDGYCTDMTRTVALGEPGEQKRRTYDMVLRAHLAGLEALRAGAVCSDVDKVARDILAASGLPGSFGHGLGHAVGIEIHEAPRLSYRCHDTVRSGMMLTVEPGLYWEGHYGCRIEDTVFVTDEGPCPLPQSPKELLIL